MKKKSNPVGRRPGTGKFKCTLPSSRVEPELYNDVLEISNRLSVGVGPAVRIILKRYTRAYLDELQKMESHGVSSLSETA